MFEKYNLLLSTSNLFAWLNKPARNLSSGLKAKVR